MSDVPTRLLRETLRDAVAPASSASSASCIDTGMLAAWSDGTLSARERAAAESHASSCLRCQALLAAMARTSPPAAARGWWRASTIGWLVPVAVAAAAVLLWIDVQGRRPARSAAPPPVSAAASSTVREPSTPSAERPAESKDAERAPQRTAKADEPRARTATGAAQSFARRAEQANAARGAMRDAAVAPSSPTPPPVAAPPSQTKATEVTTTSTADASPASAGKPVPPARALTEQVMIGARAQLMGKALAVPTVVVSPDPNVRWRVVNGGVERSIDGGTTWETQSTGVPATLTAGAAPSPTICWLVGPGGIVVLSNDGRTWQRVQFPEAIDLTSIRASDGTNATVTAADGRTFTTVDAGKTWRADR